MKIMMYYDEEEFDQEIMIDKLLNETIYKNKKNDN
jgi:hypothetical protein